MNDVGEEICAEHVLKKERVIFSKLNFSIVITNFNIFLIFRHPKLKVVLFDI